MQTQTEKPITEIRFLLHGKSYTVNVDRKNEIVFYQRKKAEISIISVKRVQNVEVSDIQPFLEADKSIWE